MIDEAASIEANPGTLNTWLRNNGGYQGHNNLDESKIPSINPQRIDWPADGMHRGNDLEISAIKKYLMEPRVVIANVDAGHHFVLVTGWIENDNDTLLVNDPGFDRQNYSLQNDVVGFRIFDMKRGDRTASSSRASSTVRVEQDQFVLNHVEALCNDGSKGGFYYRPPKTDESSWLSVPWVVYLEGGGWCYNKESCDNRFKEATHLMSSNGWETTLMKRKGIFDLDCEANPAFCVAHHVYIRYCSSDGWTGRRSSTESGYTFQGSMIVDSVFEMLINSPNLTLDPSASKILLTGCSAGGRGSMFNIDRIKNKFGLTNFSGMFDSGWWLTIPQMNASKVVPSASLVDQAKMVFSLANSTLDESCVEEFPGEEWKCFFAPYAIPYVETRSLSQVFQYDKFQLDQDTHGQKPPFVPDTASYVEDFREQMVSTLQNAAANMSFREDRDMSIYSPACYDHCSITSNRFSSTKVSQNETASPISLSQVVHTWWTSSSREPSANLSNESLRSSSRLILDNCVGFNCSVAC